MRRAPGLARVVGSAALVGLVAGCLARRPKDTIWPPEDYFLDVHVVRDGRERQRVRVWAGGVVAYAEATAWLADPVVAGATLPVYSRLSVYRLHPRSVRQLARAIERAGLYDLDEVEPGVPVAAAGAARMVARWQLFASRGTASAEEGNGAVVRAVRVLNGYLPSGHLLSIPRMGGESEPRRVSRTPAPADSVDQALALHEDLVELQPADAALREHTLALALAAAGSAGADALLEQWQEEGLDDGLMVRLRAIALGDRAPLSAGGG